MMRSNMLVLLICTTLTKITQLRIMIRKTNLHKNKPTASVRWWACVECLLREKWRTRSNELISVLFFACFRLFIGCFQHFLLNCRVCCNGKNKRICYSEMRDVQHMDLLFLQRASATFYCVSFFTIGLIVKISCFLLFTCDVTKHSRVVLCEGGIRMIKNHICT